MKLLWSWRIPQHQLCEDQEKVTAEVRMLYINLRCLYHCSLFKDKTKITDIIKCKYDANMGMGCT